MVYYAHRGLQYRRTKGAPCHSAKRRSPSTSDRTIQIQWARRKTKDNRYSTTSPIYCHNCWPVICHPRGFAATWVRLKYRSRAIWLLWHQPLCENEFCLRTVVDSVANGAPQGQRHEFASVVMTRLVCSATRRLIRCRSLLHMCFDVSTHSDNRPSPSLSIRRSLSIINKRSERCCRSCVLFLPARR